ncbi:hypothetical protein L1887_12277 [Cichorium endivia]|nr:hypothetical protein L1887_12277 [Cichorium endivia]
MKLSESSKAFVDQTMNLSVCGEMCKKNCSCAAYANMNITQGGSGCVILEVDLMDMRQYAGSEDGGQDLYVRVASSYLGGALLLLVIVEERDRGSDEPTES